MKKYITKNQGIARQQWQEGVSNLIPIDKEYLDQIPLSTKAIITKVLVADFKNLTRIGSDIYNAENYLVNVIVKGYRVFDLENIFNNITGEISVGVIDIQGKIEKIDSKGLDLVERIIARLLANCLDNFNLNKTMTRTQVDEYVIDLVENYKYGSSDNPSYTLEDFVLFFYKCKSGHFGKPHITIDRGVFDEWLKVYDNKRSLDWIDYIKAGGVERTQQIATKPLLIGDGGLDDYDRKRIEEIGVKGYSEELELEYKNKFLMPNEKTQAEIDLQTKREKIIEKTIKENRRKHRLGIDVTIVSIEVIDVNVFVKYKKMTNEIHERKILIDKLENYGKAHTVLFLKEADNIKELYKYEQIELVKKYIEFNLLKQWQEQ